MSLFLKCREQLFDFGLLAPYVEIKLNSPAVSHVTKSSESPADLEDLDP